MRYLVFSALFTIIHTVAYFVAGVVALGVSQDLYEGEDRLLDFMRNMSDEAESGHVQRWVLPAQILRGLLLSVVLYPLLGFLGEQSFWLRFAFLAGLLFVYTDFASAVPFNHNIEGFVYLRARYMRKEAFWKLYMEMIVYSLLVGAAAGALLF
jgi:hypothetical protein